MRPLNYRTIARDIIDALDEHLNIESWETLDPDEYRDLIDIVARILEEELA